MYRSAGGRLRRTWPQRLLISFNAVCIVVALVGAGTVVYAKQTVSQISRETTIGRDQIIPTDEVAPGAPQNFLIVGVDQDDGLAADDPVRSGRDKGPSAAFGLRSDTIMVARVEPGTNRARILSFPRDLWVDIPGHGRQRINAAIQYGADAGPSLLIQTIKENFGIDINHYVQVNFAGFKSLVRQIGGVYVYVSTPVRDFNSGLNQPVAGCVLLDQDQALAYARSRHLQYQKSNGEWAGEPTSDLGRIKRQQDFTRRVIKRAISKGAKNPATLAKMVNTGTKNLALDPFTTAKDLFNLGRAFKSYDPDTLLTDNLPVVDAVRGGAQVLDLVESGAEPILEMYRGTGSSGSAADIAPSTITVRVLNGTRKLNQGANTAAALQNLGFKVTSPGSAASLLQSEVRYAPGQEAAAVAVARYLDAQPALVPDDSVAEVTLVTGPDFMAVRDRPRPVAEIPRATALLGDLATTGPWTNVDPNVSATPARDMPGLPLANPPACG